MPASLRDRPLTSPAASARVNPSTPAPERQASTKNTTPPLIAESTSLISASVTLVAREHAGRCIGIDRQEVEFLPVVGEAVAGQKQERVVAGLGVLVEPGEARRDVPLRRLAH